MRAERLTLVVVMAAALGSGCDALGLLGSCPEPPTRSLEPGGYRTTRTPDVGPDNDPGFAHAGAGPKAMTIDRAGGRVVFEYERGGKRIREVWRIKSESYVVR
jgi:hypothetical protein